MFSAIAASRIRALYLAAALAFMMNCAVAESLSARDVDTAAVDRFVAEHLSRTGISGVSIALISGDSVVLAKGYGHDSRNQPMTADTPMYIASLSKAFTALAVMQLVEAQQIDLDKPVRDYLHEFVLSDPRAARITVRQILNQSSGMSDELFSEWTNPGPASLTLAVARLNNAKLAADPGTKFFYHNPNYHVAARMVEVVSGEPFAQYLQRHIFAPLGMTNTISVDRLDELPNGMADGHVVAFGQAIPASAPALFGNGAAGIVTTASDMAKWLIAQSNNGLAANGTRILSAEGIRTMQSPSSPDGAYGLGWVVQINRDPPRIAHTGLVPTYNAYAGIFPSERFAVAVLVNSGWTIGTGYEAYSIASGIVAIQQGQPAVSFGENVFALDVFLIWSSAALLILGVATTMRARRWAIRCAEESLAIITFRLVPYITLLALILAAPGIAGRIVVGRPTTWLWVAYFSPTLFVFLLSLGCFSGVTIVARSITLLRNRNSKIDHS